jgi:hypothetical protein
VQLEGGIDDVERCLAKVFGIVTGERWAPTGIIVEGDSVEEGSNNGACAGSTTKATTAATKATTATTKAVATAAPASGDPTPSTTTMNPSSKGREETPATTAEAVIVKVWTSTSKLLNLGKIRKVQRKTNTIIRRKKLRLVGGGGGANSDSNALANEKEEDMMDDNEASDNDEEEGAKESSLEGV